MACIRFLCFFSAPFAGSKDPGLRQKQHTFSLESSNKKDPNFITISFINCGMAFLSGLAKQTAPKVQVEHLDQVESTGSIFGVIADQKSSARSFHGRIVGKKASSVVRHVPFKVSNQAEE